MKEKWDFRTLGKDLWSLDYERWEKGLHLSLRMPIVRLDGGLFLYSPVQMLDEHVEEVAKLGRVRWILAPNLNHHKFAADAAQRYPEAELLGAKGLGAKRPDLAFAEEVSGAAKWDGLQGLLVGGVPFTNEVVLHHEASGSLICADYVSNPRGPEELATKLLWRSLGVWEQCGQNRWWRFRTKDREAARDSAETITSWGAERIVMCHGAVIDSGGQAVLRNAVSWLLDG